MAAFGKRTLRSGLLGAAAWPKPQGAGACGPTVFPPSPPRCDELAPLPKALESLPAVLEKAVRDGVKRALGEAPPVTTEGSPGQAQPFRGTPFRIPVFVVMTSGNAEAQAAATELITALTGMGTLTVVTLTDSTNSNLLTFSTPPYFRAVVDCVELFARNRDAFTFLDFRVVVGGRTITKDALSLGSLRELKIQAPQDTQIQIKVRNRDVLSAFLLTGWVCGWLYPVQEVADTLAGAVVGDDPAQSDPAPCQPCPAGLPRSLFGGATRVTAGRGVVESPTEPGTPTGQDYVPQVRVETP